MQLELIETKVMMMIFAIGKRVYRLDSDDEQCKLLSVNLLFLPRVAITEFWATSCVS